MEVLETAERIITTPFMNRESFFEELYERAFPGVAKFVRKMHGSFEDAKDVFHDALVIFYEKSVDSNFIVQSSDEAYLLGISKHLWIRKYNHNCKNVMLDAFESQISIPNDFYPTFNDNKLLVILERTGKKCMDLLLSFYYDNISVKKITTKLGYKNEHSTTVQKYKCLEKIRETIKEKSIAYEDFIE